MKRFRLKIRGDVKSVGLEQNIRAQAKMYGLDGTIRGAGDGLEVILQGDEAKVRKLTVWLETDPGRSDVMKVEMSTMSPDPSLTGKGISIY